MGEHLVPPEREINRIKETMIGMIFYGFILCWKETLYLHYSTTLHYCQINIVA